MISPLLYFSSVNSKYRKCLTFVQNSNSETNIILLTPYVSLEQIQMGYTYLESLLSTWFCLRVTSFQKHTIDILSENFSMCLKTNDDFILQ